MSLRSFINMPGLTPPPPPFVFVFLFFGLGFCCFVVINPRVLLANRVDFGLFLFYKFSNFTPPPPTGGVVIDMTAKPVLAPEGLLGDLCHPEKFDTAFKMLMKRLSKSSKQSRSVMNFANSSAETLELWTQRIGQRTLNAISKNQVWAC